MMMMTVCCVPPSSLCKTKRVKFRCTPVLTTHLSDVRPGVHLIDAHFFGPIRCTPVLTTHLSDVRPGVLVHLIDAHFFRPIRCTPGRTSDKCTFFSSIRCTPGVHLINGYKMCTYQMYALAWSALRRPGTVPCY